LAGTAHCAQRQPETPLDPLSIVLSVAFVLGLIAIIRSLRSSKTPPPPQNSAPTPKAERPIAPSTPEPISVEPPAVSAPAETVATETSHIKAPAPAPIPTGSAPIKVTAPVQPREILVGAAYVIDGDSLRIKKREIRLFGVDAPEFNHPHGKTAKWALFKLCKGERVHAHIIAEDDHGRCVARCTLDDGRDLSAEMVKLGLALDWPKFSNGRYRVLEADGLRRKLWLADARQKGRMHVWDAYEARQRDRAKN